MKLWIYDLVNLEKERCLHNFSSNLDIGGKIKMVSYSIFIVKKSSNRNWKRLFSYFGIMKIFSYWWGFIRTPYPNIVLLKNISRGATRSQSRSSNVAKMWSSPSIIVQCSWCYVYVLLSTKILNHEEDYP